MHGVNDICKEEATRISRNWHKFLASLLPAPASLFGLIISRLAKYCESPPPAMCGNHGRRTSDD